MDIQNLLPISLRGNINSKQKKVLYTYAITLICLYFLYNKSDTSETMKKYIKGIFLASSATAIGGLYLYK